MSGARLDGAMRPRALPAAMRPALVAATAALRRAPPGLVRLAPGVLALAVAAALFLALGPGGSARRVSAAALAVAGQLRAEDEGLRRELHRPAPGTTAASAAPVPQRFLREVVAAAGASGLRITRLAPAQHGEALELEAGARFPELVRFATEVELARGALRGLRVRAARGDGVLEVAVTLDPPREAGASEAQAAAARAALAAAPRDPFALPRTLAMPHRLTGITVLAGGALMATIDGRDYQAGDALDEGPGDASGNVQVRALGPDWAELALGGRTTRLRLDARAR